MKPTPQLQAAMDFLGARLAETGGGCTAWEFDHGESYSLITIPENPSAPLTLREPCRMGTYDADTGALPENQYPDDAKVFPSVFEALRELYGREEGSEWPACLSDDALDAETRDAMLWDGGSLANPDSGVIYADESAETELARFHAECFDTDGAWKPAILDGIIAMLQGMRPK